MPFVICDHGPIEAKIVPDDCLATPGMCRPGFYETILIKSARLVDWERHWQRFDTSCKKIGLGGERTRFKELVEKQADHFSTTSRLRLMAYNKPVSFSDAKPYTYMAAVWPATQTCRDDTFKCTLAKSRRAVADSDYNLKKLGQKYIDIELERARENGFDDILFLNDREEICEASYSNFWLVSGDSLITTPVDSPCLPGITRERILMLASQLQLNVQIQPVTFSALSAASEIFLTSSIRGIQPVSEVDGLRFNPDITLQVARSFNVTRV